MNFLLLFTKKKYTRKDSITGWQVKFTLVHAKKPYWGVEVYLHSFLTLTLDRVTAQAGLHKLENRYMGKEPQFLHPPAHSLDTVSLIYQRSNRITAKCELTLMPCHLEMALSGRSARRVRRDLNTFRFSFSSISKLNIET